MLNSSLEHGVDGKIYWYPGDEFYSSLDIKLLLYQVYDTCHRKLLFYLSILNQCLFSSSLRKMSSLRRQGTVQKEMTKLALLANHGKNFKASFNSLKITFLCFPCRKSHQQLQNFFEV